MSLVGKYHSKEINSNLIIKDANNANGQASGQIEIGGITIPVKIHYHFENNVGPVTNLWFAGNQDNPNEYIGGAGRTNNTNFATIDIAGGYPTDKDVSSFEGTYVRQ